MTTWINNNKNNLVIIGMLVVITIVCFIGNYNGEIDNYNTTILALNYKYGFVSRGLLGTVFWGIDAILPFSIMNARGASLFLHCCTLVFYIIMLFFAFFILKRTNENSKKSVLSLLIILFICVVTTFAHDANLGRIDLFMIAISVIGVMLILVEKCEWIIPILTAIAVMMHQGYVLMYFNIVLVFLWYKIFTKEEKKQKVKYLIIFVLSIIIASALFLYLEVFSHASKGLDVYENVANLAASLSFDGTFHETLLQHEILGVDLSEVEHGYHMKNLAEIIVYAVLTLPYIIILVRFFKKLFTKSKGFAQVIKYLAFLLGPLTMLPDFLIKVDYGRWVLSVTVYYLVMILVFMTIDDLVKECFNNEIDTVRKKGIWAVVLLIYPAILLPFYDVNINQITSMIGHVANREFLHWW